MDEPSRGIDIGAKADVFRIMRSLAAQGLGIVFVTSDLDEVLALSDRIAVMSNGRLTALLDRADATEAEDRRRFVDRSRTYRTPDARRKLLAMSAAAQSAANAVGGSLTLNLMRLRTFIALFAVLAVLLVCGAELSVGRQSRADVEARRAQRLPGDRHDLRHHHRGHRSLGRLDRRPVRNGRRRPDSARNRSAVRLHGVFQHSRDHPDHARARRADRPHQRPLDHTPQRRALHSDARHALCRARLRAASVRRLDLPQPRGKSGVRNDGLRFPWSGRVSASSGLDLDACRRCAGRGLYRALDPARAAHLRGRRQRARGRALGHPRQSGEAVRLHVLRLLRGDRRSDHFLAN